MKTPQKFTCGLFDL